MNAAFDNTKKPTRKFNQTIWLAIIAGVVTLGNTFLTMRVQNKVDSVQTKIDTVHSVVNHRMDEMLRLVEQKSTAEGVIQGKAQQVTKDSLDKHKK